MTGDVAQVGCHQVNRALPVIGQKRVDNLLMVIIAAIRSRRPAKDADEHIGGRLAAALDAQQHGVACNLRQKDMKLSRQPDGFVAATMQVCVKLLAQMLGEGCEISGGGALKGQMGNGRLQRQTRFKHFTGLLGGGRGDIGPAVGAQFHNFARGQKQL